MRTHKRKGQSDPIQENLQVIEDIFLGGIDFHPDAIASKKLIEAKF